MAGTSAYFLSPGTRWWLGLHRARRALGWPLRAFFASTHRLFGPAVIEGDIDAPFLIGHYPQTRIAAGDFAGAIAYARRIRDFDMRDSVWAQIAEAQGRAGEIAAAGASIAEIGGGDARVLALLRLCAAQARAGDGDAADETMAIAHEHIEAASGQDRQAMIEALAVAEAALGHGSAAIAVAESLAGEARDTVMGAIAAELAAELATEHAAELGAGGRDDQAKAAIAAIGDPAWRAAALADLAAAAARRGDEAGARRWLGRFEASETEMDSAPPSTLCEIALHLGELERASAIAQRIDQPILRVRRLADLAVALAAEGRGADARAAIDAARADIRAMPRRHRRFAVDSLLQIF